MSNKIPELTRQNAKSSLSQHRWDRLRMLQGNIHGYMYNYANGIPVRSVAFYRDGYVYGVSVGKKGQLVFTRYHVLSYTDFWCFREDPKQSPHPPF